MVDEIFDEGRMRWTAAIDRAFGPTPASQQITGSPDTILRALEPFLGHGIAHAHFSSGGGLDMLAGNVGVEPGTVELVPSDKIAFLVKPARLAFHYIAAAPAESFLYLEAAPLSPSGVYTGYVGDPEEVVDLGRDGYVARSVWDQGYLRYDGDGDEVPLPAEARLLMRVLGGSILFVQHGSIWNQNSHTYDGRLQSKGDDAILAAINGAIERA